MRQSHPVWNYGPSFTLCATRGVVSPCLQLGALVAYYVELGVPIVTFLCATYVQLDIYCHFSTVYDDTQISWIGEGIAWCIKECILLFASLNNLILDFTIISMKSIWTMIFLSTCITFAVFSPRRSFWCPPIDGSSSTSAILENLKGFWCLMFYANGFDASVWIGPHVPVYKSNIELF